MKQSVRNAFFVILLMAFNTNILGQQIKFKKLLPTEDQSFSAVTGFAQDSKGLMWITTRNGLYSYDGNQMISFKNNPSNPNSITSNILVSICADDNGNIWTGGIGGGLNRLDSETGIFTHFMHDRIDPASLSNDTVPVIFQDRKGTLWIGTQNGLDKFDPETNTFIHYRNNPDEPASLSCNQVRTIYEDKQGTLWIGTGNPYPSNGGGGPDEGGLNRMNKENGTFTRFLHDSKNDKSLINNKVTAIFEDNRGTLWVGTAKNGIHKMDKQEGTFEQIFSDPEHPEKYSNSNIILPGLQYDCIAFFIRDSTEICWFGTYGSGLYKFDTENGIIVRYEGTENSSTGIDDYGVRAGFSSRDGILWFGSSEINGGNIYYMDPAHKEIQHTSVSGASVTSFYEDTNGNFWIGTENELVLRNKESGRTKNYMTDDYDYSEFFFSGLIVNGDNNGDIWLGTSKGLNLLDKKNEKFITYKHDPLNNNSLSDDRVITIYEDNKSNFWIGTAYGLNLMNRKTGLFERFYPHREYTYRPFGPNFVRSIIEDKSGKLWIGAYTGGGVNLFSPESKNFKNYLKDVWIQTLYQDAEGVLWAGGPVSLYKFDPESDNFLPFSIPGFPDGISNVRSIIEDKQKNLWLTTSNQIVRINSERNEISFYGQNYGVGQNEFKINSAYIKRNGEIYFGDATGYFSFFPDEFIKNLKAPEISFTNLHLSNKKLVPGDGGPLKENLNEQKEIHFQYDQNVFSIDLAIIDYANPEQNRMNYFLENYDIDWRNANSERRAYYFNVPPGKYTFRVQGVNSYGVWAEKKLDIIILPPWWKTWWAYAIYAILFIAAVFGVDRFQRARLLQKEKEKNRVRELAHAKEIEKAYTELKSTQTQLIQSEKMASLGELTAGIAHEIQNPLNFVNNFSEINKELIDELKEELVIGNRQSAEEIANDIKENEEKINHHGKRADAIVKGMLQHSRTSNGIKEPTDINALADEYLRLSFHGLRAKDKSFNADFKTNFDPDLPKINVIPQDIGRVLLNLINNAFYAAPLPPEGGFKDPNYVHKPTVTVSTASSKSPSGDLGVEIRVKDNGPGIPDSIKDKIFQPFFTTKPTGQGTGLGLSLSYDIVKAHGGEINVESREGEGTEFIIQLPIKST